MPRDSVPLLDAIAAAQRTPQRTPPRTPPGSPAKIMILDEFLARPELDALVEWVTGHESEFGRSRVISPGRPGGLHEGHRRSKVLYAAGPLQAVFEQRLMSVLDHVRLGLGQPAFAVRSIETQITATNDGEFFRAHTDNSNKLLAGRRLTYVYFFHREPARFSGGRLRFFGSADAAGPAAPRPLIAEVVPRQNQAVFFLPHYFHEIETVSCPSRRFLDSRFTVNGWYWAS